MMISSSTDQIWVGLECKPKISTQLDNHDNKTQCQPCKRLAWPIIPHSRPGLEKGISECDHFGAVKNHFSVY